MLSEFWKLGVQNQVLHRATLLLKPIRILEKNPFSPLPSLWWLPAILGTILRIPCLTASLPPVLSAFSQGCLPAESVCLRFPFLIQPLSFKRRTPFPNKVTFMGTNEYGFNISFLETQIKSQYALSPFCPSFSCSNEILFSCCP